jgi:hypothetical protein
MQLGTTFGLLAQFEQAMIVLLVVQCYDFLLELNA